MIRRRFAEIIVLDQFSRNIFRVSALFFAGDAQALDLAQEAVAKGGDQTLRSGAQPHVSRYLRPSW